MLVNRHNAAILSSDLRSSVQSKDCNLANKVVCDGEDDRVLECEVSPWPEI